MLMSRQKRKKRHWCVVLLIVNSLFLQKLAKKECDQLSNDCAHLDREIVSSPQRLKTELEEMKKTKRQVRLKTVVEMLCLVDT